MGEELLPPGSEITLENCHREPIQTPGAIQPHGALLAVTGPEREIIQRSENAQDRLGQSAELLGSSLDDLVGSADAVWLTAPAGGLEYAESPLQASSSGAAGLRPRVVTVGDLRFDAFGYAVGDGVTVIEFEPSGTLASAEALADDVAGLLVALQSADSPLGLLRSAAAWVHQLTGFDRVWVYRFEEDDHGVVICEERREALEPFLGLHFPARDIPPQARALLLTNRVRFIPDSFGTASPLVPLVNPVTDDWLDLSGGILRAVSPMHLQYLQNMGATASMSIALEVDGRLWGLISGHHYAGPRLVEHRIRLACEVLGRVVSTQLSALGRETLAGLRAGVDLHREAILGVLARAGSGAGAGTGAVSGATGASGLAGGLTEAGGSLLAICAADGAGAVIGTETELVGDTPSAEAIHALIAAVPAGEVFISDALSVDLPALAPALAPISGAVVLPLARAGGAHLVWFRNEYVRSVTWGDSGLAPAKGRLSPTGSYATWSESVTGMSRPWSALDREAVLSLRAGIGTVVLDQAEALAAANRELARSNSDLEAFTFVVAHDLREPLRNIQSFLGFFLEDHGEGLDAEGAEQLGTIGRLSERMDALMDSLLEHARAGRLGPVPADLSLQALVTDAASMLGPASSRGAIEVLAPDVMVRADRDAMAHILINLFSNAIKYSPGDSPRVEVDARRDAAGMVIVEVRDFGIGVPAEFHDAIFELFRRLHARDAYGGGSGAGLAIAKRLAQRQGGDLWLEASDTDGGGSTFCFSVPGV